ncbi:MAG: type IV pilus twitching motility protein PilT [Acidimicrobiales bacterium]
MSDLQGSIEQYLRFLWQGKGTDLHLSVGVSAMGRFDGDLRAIGAETVIDEAHMQSILTQLLNADQLTRYERDLDVDFALTWHEVARLRGNAFRQRGLPSIALRVIPREIPTFDELGLNQTVRDFAKMQQGLVLFTGPTGSGKSTSMAAMVASVNATRRCHIITIEDPIEYVHANNMAVVNQREIGLDALSFERALRSALREDPDVVLVGEMRDPESIAITLTLAETGHLVFSSLHTNDAGQTLDRIVDSFPAERQGQIRLQLASVLRGVVAQRLLPHKRGTGRIAAFEVLVATQAVSNLVREGKTRQLRNAMQMGQAEGNQTLETDLNRLVASDVITYESALSHAFVPHEINPPHIAVA